VTWEKESLVSKRKEKRTEKEEVAKGKVSITTAGKGGAVQP